MIQIYKWGFINQTKWTRMHISAIQRGFFFIWLLFGYPRKVHLSCTPKTTQNKWKVKKKITPSHATICYMLYYTCTVEKEQLDASSHGAIIMKTEQGASEISGIHWKILPCQKQPTKYPQNAEMKSLLNFNLYCENLLSNQLLSSHLFCDFNSSCLSSWWFLILTFCSSFSPPCPLLLSSFPTTHSHPHPPQSV